MFEVLKSSIIEWNQTRSDREKLQHTYVLLIVICIFLAGVMGLINSDRAADVLYVAIALLIALVVNLVTWSLLKTTVLDKLPTRRVTAVKNASSARPKRG
jgi:uncharacterized membrane protein